MYMYKDGSKYVGEFKDGKKNGQGTATFANGDKYVGEFMNADLPVAKPSCWRSPTPWVERR